MNDDPNAFDDLPEGKSKSQLKREMTELQAFGESLVALKPAQLEKLPLGDPLAHAIDVYQRLPNSHIARKRQAQFIGKLIRGIDIDALNSAVDKLKATPTDKAKTKQLRQQYCQQILTEGDSAINQLLEQYPQLERQTLRQFSRQYRQGSDPVKSKTAAKLLAYLTEMSIGKP